jgi:hypothetical protein
MKLGFLFKLSVLLIAFSFATFSQETDRANINLDLSAGTESLDKNMGGGLNVQDVNIYALPDNGATSGNARAPQGSQRYARTVYLITAAELMASGFPSNEVINLIGFRYSVAQSVETTGDFKVYLQNTTDASYSKGSDVWTDIITPMTLAHDNPVTIPAATGFWNIPFVNGSAFTYTGGGLYVAFEYQNAAGTLSTNNTALCNTALVGGLKNAFSTTTLPTSVGATASNFRPGTTLGTNLDDVVEVVRIYSLGKVALPSGNPVKVSALVQNKSGADISFDVVLTIFRASDSEVRFTNTKSVSNLGAGLTQVVNFDDWNADAIEFDSVEVEIVQLSGETYTLNNRKVNVLDLNEDTFSYAQGTATTGVGANANTIDIAAKYTVNTGTTVDQISVGFTTAGQPYTLGIYSADGPGGAPGTNLFTSTSQSTTMAMADIPVSPAVNVNGDFYVVVTQTGTTNFGVLYQTESPLRTSTFFLRVPAGAGAWSDFAPANAFRVVIEPRVVDGPVPVELVSFAASSNNNEVSLTWKTATEINNKGFQVERKIMNGEFIAVVFIDGKGTTTEIQSYSYSEKVDIGSYTYRLKQIDFDGTFAYSFEVEVDVTAPAVYNLSQNYPNPFNPATKINYSLAADSKVKITIFDAIGQEIAVLVNGTRAAGNHEANFNASSINSGVYFYRIDAQGIDGSSYSSVKKMMLTK